jgi:hypothetical protein
MRSLALHMAQHQHARASSSLVSNFYAATFDSELLNRSSS